MLVVAIVLLALFFRCYHLVRVPTGLSPIEAYVGNRAALMLERPADIESTSAPLFVRLQSFSVGLFGHYPWALRVIPALAGTLTVLGLYLLVQMLTNWQIAAIASFLLAVSSWHVTFSRTGFAEIMVPLIATWGLCFFWKALSRASIPFFAVSGLIFGIGLYLHQWFWLFFAVPLLTAAAYLQLVKKDFDHSKYTELRNKVARGIAIGALVVFLVWLPLGFQMYLNPDAVLTAVSERAPIAPDRLEQFLNNFWKTLGMFFSQGDPDWLHGVGGQPLLWWPLAALAAVGFAKSTIKLIKLRQEHGHFSTMQVMLLSWFVVGILPSALTSGQAPDSLRALGAAPVAMFFGAEGIWWLMQFARRWYGARDTHGAAFGEHFYKEAGIITGALLAALLVSIATQSFSSYFGEWASDPRTAKAYFRQTTATAQLLIRQKPARTTYIHAVSDYQIDGMPAAMQTFTFISNTATPEKQKARKFVFLTSQQYKQRQFPQTAPLVELTE